MLRRWVEPPEGSCDRDPAIRGCRCRRDRIEGRRPASHQRCLRAWTFGLPDSVVFDDTQLDRRAGRLAAYPHAGGHEFGAAAFERGESLATSGFRQRQVARGALQCRVICLDYVVGTGSTGIRNFNEWRTFAVASPPTVQRSGAFLDDRQPTDGSRHAEKVGDGTAPNVAGLEQRPGPQISAASDQQDSESDPGCKPLLRHTSHTGAVMLEAGILTHLRVAQSWADCVHLYPGSGMVGREPMAAGLNGIGQWPGLRAGMSHSITAAPCQTAAPEDAPIHAGRLR